MTNMAPHKSQFGALKDEQRFFGADLEAMLVSRRRNVEAMMQMSRLTLGGVQQAWRRQLDFFEQAVEGFTNLVSSFGQPNGLSEEQLVSKPNIFLASL
jgi:hypothetical protein